MQTKKHQIKGKIKNYIFLLLFVLCTSNSQGQIPCQDSLNFITKAYNDGEWSSCKDASLGFIRNFPVQDARLFSSKSSNRQKYSPNCQNSIPKVYYYLIKSYLRLFDIDNAVLYYREAILKEYNIDFDSTDNKLMTGFGKLTKYSFSMYLGSVSTNLKEYRILNEFKLGTVFGFGPNSYVELSFTKRIFNHRSDHRQGIFGKPLKNNAATFPTYNFSFSGNDRFFDMAYLKKFLLYQNNLNDLYFSAGLYINYYLNSQINDYGITINNFNHRDTINSKNYTVRNDRIDTLNIHMDLKAIYKERFNAGLFVSYGSITKLRKGYELFAELRYTIGKNFSYRYFDFRNYKVGVDYFTIVVGITKGFKRIKVKKILDPL
ncbi:MAG: hypothetical protein ABI760_11560 [Ferruginibacter sp.]